MPPRTLHRVPAIEAWQEKHREDFGAEVIDVPLETWPEHFPNLAQARFLISAGRARAPHRHPHPHRHPRRARRQHRPPAPGDLQRHFAEDITGTAIDHLGRGLFEAHGRDEAGFEEEAGHRDMWFTARDIAFPEPGPDIDVETMLERMGFGQGSPGTGSRQATAARRHRRQPRVHGGADGAHPAHRGAGLPHLRLGRRVAGRPRPRGRRRLGGGDRPLHPGRRDAPRRLPRHRPHRDARPHVDRRVRHSATRART